MKNHHKKSTLQHWTKDELIDYVICLENNIEGLEERFDIQYMNCMKLIDDMQLVNNAYKEAKKMRIKRQIEKDEEGWLNSEVKKNEK